MSGQISHNWELYKEVAQLAERKAENAQLRAEVANCKKADGASKPLDAYRRMLYNEMLDTLVGLVKEKRKEIHRHDIMLPSGDIWFNPIIRQPPSL